MDGPGSCICCQGPTQHPCGSHQDSLTAMGLFSWPYGSYVQAKRPRKIRDFWIHLTLVWNKVTRKITKFWTDLTDQNHLSDETPAVTHAQNTQIVPKPGSISQKWSHWEFTCFNNYSQHFSDTEGAFVTTVERNQNVHKRKETSKKNGTLGCPVIYTAAQLML